MKDDSLLLDYRALVLRPVFSGKYRSEIITTHGTYYSIIKPIELLNKACLRHHSSKKGRKEATKALFNFKKKPPFLISDEVGVFPTKSSTNPECIYIFGHFFEEEFAGKDSTNITFSNGTSILVPVSMHTITLQKFRLHIVLSHAQQSKRYLMAAAQHAFATMEPEPKPFQMTNYDLYIQEQTT